MIGEVGGFVAVDGFGADQSNIRERPCGIGEGEKDLKDGVQVGEGFVVNRRIEGGQRYHLMNDTKDLKEKGKKQTEEYKSPNEMLRKIVYN